MAALIGVFVAVALGAWLLAIASALSIVSMAPPGSRIACYFDLGAWRFRKILALIGPQAAKPIDRYKLAFAIFFCAVLAIALSAILAAS
jgi:hypothetical protein